MKETLYFDMDGVLADYEKALNEGRNQREKGFYANLEPIPGMVDAFHKLSKVFDVYVLSTPSWSNPDSWGEKREWVEKHLGESGFKRLILTHNKSLLKGQYLVDDHTWNGADEFEGQLILFGSEDFPDAESVLNYLLPNGVMENEMEQGGAIIENNNQINNTMENTTEQSYEEKVDELRELIHASLDMCDEIDTPAICQMKSTPEGYKKLEESILHRCIEGGNTISQAIIQVEKENNINRIDD